MTSTFGDESPEFSLNPPYDCDLIMKGGVTSGVVYPAAIVELARHHRLHSVGGSSAGAMAAAGAVAAEYGRQQGRTQAFKTLDSMTARLSDKHGGSKTTLERLFVPQPGTTHHFNLLWKIMLAHGSGRWHRALRPIGGTALRHLLGAPTHPTFLAGVTATAGALVVALAVPATAVSGAVVGLLAMLAIVLLLAAGLVASMRTMGRRFEANHFGFCNGMGVGGQPGVTDWLHQQIQEMAFGNAEEEVPLTYGDLDSADIQLVTMTTNASQGASEPFPFTEDWGWGFHPDDAASLLPWDVAKHMVESSERRMDCPEWNACDAPDGVVPLPTRADLPVLLAARLSFPIPPMISAFPLYRRVHVDDGRDRFEKVWMTDGGICSNLPVHLFDAALPSRPTYGINLSYGETAAEAGDGDPRSLVHRPKGSRGVEQGSQLRVHEIADAGGFLKRALEAMKTWSDNSVRTELGVVDRICTIQLSSREGGFNLDMDGSTLGSLEARGRAAGTNLSSMVLGPGDDARVAEDQWLRHRWVRLLATVEGVAQLSQKLADRYGSEAIIPQHGMDRLSYEDLVHRSIELRERLRPDCECCDGPACCDEATKTCCNEEPTRCKRCLHEWTEPKQQELLNKIANLSTMTVGDALLDVSASERRLVLSTRPPIYSIPPDPPVEPAEDVART